MSAGQAPVKHDDWRYPAKSCYLVWRMDTSGENWKALVSLFPTGWQQAHWGPVPSSACPDSLLLRRCCGHYCCMSAWRTYPYLTSKGLSDAQIQLISGHQSKKNLEVYQHLSLESVDRAYQDAVQTVGI